MSLAIKLSRETYLPLRAVPLITSGLLNTPTLAHMISDPEAFCDAYNDNFLSVYSYEAGAGLGPINHYSFTSLRSKPKRESSLLSFRYLPAGLLIRQEDVKAMFNMLSNVGRGSLSRRTKPGEIVWRNTPQLSPSERKFVFEKLPQPRVNGAANLRATILETIQDIKKQVEPLGIDIDFTSMPASRSAWSQLIIELNPRIRRSPATFQDHYSDMGLRWNRGSRDYQINPIRKALNRPEI